MNCTSKQSRTTSTEPSDDFDPPSFSLIGLELPEKIDRNLIFETLETITFDLNQDGLFDTILVNKIAKWILDDGQVYHWTDPGDFHQIIITIQGKRSTTYNNIDGWVSNTSLKKYTQDLDAEGIVQSDYLILRDEGNSNYLVYLAGYTYASNPGLLTIINIYDGQDLKLIFNKKIELYGLKDFDGDGTKDLITTVWDGYYQTEEENKNRHTVYLLNGGLNRSEEFSQKFCNQLL